MKVYLLLQWEDHECEHIAGIFETVRTAEVMRSLLEQKDPDDNYLIAEHCIIKAIPETET